MMINITFATAVIYCVFIDVLMKYIYRSILRLHLNV